MAQEKESGLGPLARQIMARLGIAAPVKAEETVDVVAPKNPLKFPESAEWWREPHRGYAEEIILGNKNKPPTGVHMQPKLAESIKQLREAALNPELRKKYPLLGETWDEVAAAHPYITQYVRYLRPEDDPNSIVNGSMRWNTLWGGPDITINMALDKTKPEIATTLKHELAHIGQQLNWPTIEKGKEIQFNRKQDYLERLGEIQAFDLDKERAIKTNKKALPKYIMEKDNAYLPSDSLYKMLIERIFPNK